MHEDHRVALIFSHLDLPRSGVEGISGECKAIMQERAQTSFAEDALELERPGCLPIPGMVHVGLIS